MASLALRDWILSGSGVTWPGACTEQLGVEVRKVTTVPSLGPMRYLEVGGGSRGEGDSCVHRAIPATPEMGTRTRSTLDPREGGSGAAVDQCPGHKKGPTDQPPLQFLILAPELRPGQQGWLQYPWEV